MRVRPPFCRITAKVRGFTCQRFIPRGTARRKRRRSALSLLTTTHACHNDRLRQNSCRRSAHCASGPNTCPPTALLDQWVTRLSSFHGVADYGYLINAKRRRASSISSFSVGQGAGRSPCSGDRRDPATAVLYECRASPEACAWRSCGAIHRAISTSSPAIERITDQHATLDTRASH